MTNQQIRRIEFNDEEIGMGFNSESGQAVGTALEGFTVQENLVAPGQDVFATISIINSHEELMTSLGMSIDAQGRYGFFSASLKAQFSSSTNYNSTSTFLVAKCIVKNSLKRGKNFRVTSGFGGAQELLNANRFDEFKRAFGDSFVRGLQTGGEFYCVIRITSVSATKQRNLALTLQAEYNGLVASGDFKGEFSQANASESTRSEYVATMYQRAGIGQQIFPVVEIGEAITRYKNFPQIARENPAAYETEIATYDTLPLPIPTPEEQEDFILALQDARQKKLQYIQTKNDLEFARLNPTFFETLPSDDVLLKAISTYTSLINAVVSHAIRLSRGQISPPSFFDPSTLVPAIAVPETIPLKRSRPSENALTVAEVLSTNSNDLISKAFREKLTFQPPIVQSQVAEILRTWNSLLQPTLEAIVKSCRENNTNVLDDLINSVNGAFSTFSQLGIYTYKPSLYIDILQNIEANAGFSGEAIEIAKTEFNYIIQRINR